MKNDNIDSTMEEIAKFAEIGKTTLYKYFSGKTEILSQPGLSRYVWNQLFFSSI